MTDGGICYTFNFKHDAADDHEMGYYDDENHPKTGKTSEETGKY